MKTVQIMIESEDGTDPKLHEFECLTAFNGAHYHDCLREIFKILKDYDKGKAKKMSEAEKKMLDDLRKRCAKYFVRLIH